MKGGKQRLRPFYCGSISGAPLLLGYRVICRVHGYSSLILRFLPPCPCVSIFGYGPMCVVLEAFPGSLLSAFPYPEAFRMHRAFPTIFAAMMLNFCVRNGYRCVHHAIAARSSRDHSKPDTSSLLVSTLSNLGQVLGLLVPPAKHIAALALWPINLVVFEGPYLSPMGGLILEGASRLDAFSAYPVRTWLPSCATGVTTGAPSVRPPRSSRTRGSSPQTSCAHDR